MGFELVIPKLRATAVQRYEAAMNAQGTLTFNKIDLVAVGFVANSTDQATMLVDKGTKRIAIRVAVEREPSIKLKYNKSNTTAAVSVKAALKELDVKTVKPRRYVAAIKDNLLIVQL
jgi:hypothetical protein